jgi:hypothetical protein
VKPESAVPENVLAQLQIAQSGKEKTTTRI